MKLPVEKIWGKNTTLHQDQYVEVHHAQIKAGGYSSTHSHQKTNVFYIVRGTLMVIVDPVDSSHRARQQHVLSTGAYLEIPGGVIHRFEAVTDVDLIELYFNPLDPNDITRLDTGGVKE